MVLKQAKSGNVQLWPLTKDQNKSELENVIDNAIRKKHNLNLLPSYGSLMAIKFEFSERQEFQASHSTAKQFLD